MLRTELIRPIPELLEIHVLERGDKLAFRDARRSVTYAELATRTARLAGNLRSHGLDRGDRAVIYMDNSVEAVESYLAIARASAVGVCIDPRAADREVDYMVEHSGARVILTDLGHVERALALASRTPAIQDILVTDAGNSSATGEGVRSYEEASCIEPDLPALDDLGLDEPAWMLYTSGTTGRPKGVLLTQRSCLWVVAACWAPIAGLSDDDYVLSPLPLFHSYALDLSVLGVLAVGASEYVMGHFDTDQVLTLLRDEAVTFFPGVPTMFRYLRRWSR
jgi:rifamycin polyketide synthase module 1/2/3